MDRPDEENGIFRPVNVLCYEGYRGRETPRALQIEGRSVPVVEVLSRRRIQDHQTGRRIEVFKLRLPDARVTLRVDEDGRAAITGRSKPGR